MQREVARGANGMRVRCPSAKMGPGHLDITHVRPTDGGNESQLNFVPSGPIEETERGRHRLRASITGEMTPPGQGAAARQPQASEIGRLRLLPGPGACLASIGARALRTEIT